MKMSIFTMIMVQAVAIVILVYVIVWPWVMIALGLFLMPNPPKPEIRYGEFPFRLEYEINGQRKVIEDTLLCEFDGIGSDEGRGKFRKWKQRLASGKENILLLTVDETKIITFFPGSAEFYMSDFEQDGEVDFSFPNAIIIEKDGSITSTRLIRAQELEEQYNLRLINWDYTDPIKNRF